MEYFFRIIIYIAIAILAMILSYGFNLFMIYLIVRGFIGTGIDPYIDMCLYLSILPAFFLSAFIMYLLCKYLSKKIISSPEEKIISPHTDYSSNSSDIELEEISSS